MLAESHNKLIEACQHAARVQAESHNLMVLFVRRGFWARVKWLLFGEPASE